MLASPHASWTTPEWIVDALGDAFTQCSRLHEGTPSRGSQEHVGWRRINTALGTASPAAFLATQNEIEIALSPTECLCRSLSVIGVAMPRRRTADD
jgi:hypothetical protein